MKPIITILLFIGAVVVADYLWYQQHMTFSKLATRRYDAGL